VSWEGTRRATQRHDGIRIDLREACRSSVTRSVCGTWEMQRYFPRNGPRANAGDKWRGRPLTPRCTICCSVYCPVYHHTAAAAPLRFAALGSGAFTKRSHPDRQTDRLCLLIERRCAARIISYLGLQFSLRSAKPERSSLSTSISCSSRMSLRRDISVRSCRSYLMRCQTLCKD
jgi:hypothetical protein